MAKKPNPKNPWAGTDSQRRVAKDIRDRDNADVDKVHRKTAAYKTSMGKVGAYPEYGKPVSKFEASAAREAADRLDRQGVIQNSTYTKNTSKGMSVKEGDAQRRRLLAKYAEEDARIAKVKAARKSPTKKGK